MQMEVAYDVPGKGRIVEAEVVRVRNGISANYPEAYMRRRDPDCMLIADDQPTDKPTYESRFGQPFDDIRVRRALNMAVNKQEIVKSYYAGNAELFGYPMHPDYAGYYEPLDQMPKAAQELFEYNPEKAKQLLAEAGHPKGFSFKVQVCACSPDHMDLLPLVAAYLEKVGVKMEIQPLEYGASYDVAETYPDGYDASVVYCVRYTPHWGGEGPWERYAVYNGAISVQLGEGEYLRCRWYNLESEYGVTIRVTKYSCHNDAWEFSREDRRRLRHYFDSEVVLRKAPVWQVVYAHRELL